MSLTLQHGRPENMTERLKKEQKVYELLDLLHIEYDRVDHEPAMHMDVCEEIDKVLKAATCKNLFLCNRQKTDFYLLLIPVHFWYCHQTSANTRIFREYPILLISDSFLLILTQGLFLVKQIKKMMNIRMKF